MLKKGTAFYFYPSEAHLSILAAICRCYHVVLKRWYFKRSCSRLAALQLPPPPPPPDELRGKFPPPPLPSVRLTHVTPGGRGNNYYLDLASSTSMPTTTSPDPNYCRLETPGGGGGRSQKQLSSSASTLLSPSSSILSSCSCRSTTANFYPFW